MNFDAGEVGMEREPETGWFASKNQRNETRKLSYW